MSGAALLLSLVLQVPAPNATAQASARLHDEYSAILDGEAKELKSLIDKLAGGQEKEAADELRKLLPQPAGSDGATRFVPLPEVVPAPAQGLANIPPGKWQGELEASRTRASASLFSLAEKAASARPPHLALADACLRAVIARVPAHAEARRLLGFVPYNGGWATPFAVEQFKKGKIPHPIYGWVPKGWVPHLAQGELPGRVGSGELVESWLPADQADALRRDFASGWLINTEHFAVRTNVPLSEAIAFGRQLETMHDLFESVLADVIGEQHSLAQRFKTKTAGAEKDAELYHDVSYYATRAEFVDTLKRTYRAEGDEFEQSLGFYRPPEGRTRRSRAYFFRDKDGEIDVSATLYHEVSHQLLFESGGPRPDAYKSNVGNYWVFEGLGTYFETLVVEPDEGVRLGGLVGALRESAFTNRADIYLHYQQASALTSFLMNGKQGAYREAFLDYVKDARRGMLKPGSWLSLEARLGASYGKLQVEFLDYLKAVARKPESGELQGAEMRLPAREQLSEGTLLSKSRTSRLR
jgi:hypothetical protein